MKNITRIDFTVGCANSDGKVVNGTERDISVLFNETVISTEEVNELIESGMYEYDDRIIVVSKRQADSLKDRKRELIVGKYLIDEKGGVFSTESFIVTNESKKSYYTEIKEGSRYRFIKDGIGKVQYKCVNQHTIIIVEMIDATEEQVREKIAEWFERHAEKIRKP